MKNADGVGKVTTNDNRNYFKNMKIKMFSKILMVSFVCIKI